MTSGMRPHLQSPHMRRVELMRPLQRVPMYYGSMGGALVVYTSLIPLLDQSHGDISSQGPHGRHRGDWFGVSHCAFVQLGQLLG